MFWDERAGQFVSGIVLGLCLAMGVWLFRAVGPSFTAQQKKKKGECGMVEIASKVKEDQTKQSSKGKVEFEADCCKNDTSNACDCGEAGTCCSTTTATATKSPSPRLFFASTSNTCSKLAQVAATILSSRLGATITPTDLATYEPEELVTENCALFILPTYENGTPPKSAEWFYKWLEDAVVDERIGAFFFSAMQFSVFPVGNSQYDENFNVVGRNVTKWLGELGAKSIIESRSFEGDMDLGFDEVEGFLKRWVDSVVKSLQNLPLKQKHQQQQPKQSDVNNDEEYYTTDSDNDNESTGDIEDLAGKSTTKTQTAITATTGPREMVNKQIRESLTKQGYRIVGSHSGVKMCRWTKAMLRGRGGCYKHTFYGIESHRCMEATPSLACANKCVFCWRHHSNPVGKEWKWVMDPPEVLIEGFMAHHLQMVKQMRGVPGVLPERLEEASVIRHCALSLVGEPIMYPRINEFVEMLHQNRISTYMVTNAQFPDEITRLSPVTQLYVSVDAATPETLKAIDRPLFPDYWQRFLASLAALKAKTKTRSVYRLTLVSAWNTAQVDDYAKLIAHGQPDFVEVKGVTYCGWTSTAPLTMKNVPFHVEVVAFCKALAERVNEIHREKMATGAEHDGSMYELACEHAHSCCICIANTRFKVDDQWHTWIDYDKFQDLWKKWKETGEEFSKEMYMLPTPSWALYGAVEQGFDPKETRVKTKGKGGSCATSEAGDSVM